MAFKVPVNLRYMTESILNEEIMIPVAGPYRQYLNEVPDSVEGVLIRRVTSVTKSGSGTGNMSVSGYYTGLATRRYLIQIDTEGGLGEATFKWSSDDGETWTATLVPIDNTSPIILELGLRVAFTDGTYVLGDRFSFHAEFWTEVNVVPTATKTFQVNYSTGLVTFYSGDSGLTVYASYEGRGSIDRAEFITQLIDAFNAGTVFVGKQDTSQVSVTKAVAYDLTLASAAPGGKPAIGFVRVSDVLEGEVVTFGVLDGFAGLTPGSVYYLSGVSGEIVKDPPYHAGWFLQKVGRAISTTRLFVRISDEITVVTSSMTSTTSTTATTTTSTTTTTTTTTTSP